jgi:mono/diheme cytochrome c family protein
MFHINTKEPSTIIKPLEIKIPALYADTAMQLYKGKEDKGKINWEDPTPLAVMQSEVVDRGKVLFEQNCAMCHRMNSNTIAPSLAHVEERWASADLLYHFISNSAEVLAHGNAYLNCLFCEYNKMSMPAFPKLTGKDIEDILAFVNRETVRLNIPRSSAKKIDSVLYYETRYSELTEKRNALINANGDKVTADIKPDDITYNTPDTAGLPEKVAVVTGQAEYYQIKIDAYGWYNIDLLLKDKSDVAESRLVVKIKGDYSKEINTYLVIPQLKIFTEGGLLTNGIEYGFYKRDGTIYLPPGQDAFILAIGEEKGALFLGKQSFVTAADQIIDLPVNKISKANLESVLKQLKLNNVNFSVANTVNTDSIRAIDEEMEKIRKKIPVCNCMESDTSVAEPVLAPETK